MLWGWETFYALITVVGLALSVKSGGARLAAASLVAAMWVFQGALYLARPAEVGNLTACMIDGTLLVMIATMHGRVWRSVVMLALVMQLFAHVWFRLGLLPEGDYRIYVNVLYVAQWVALGWSGGRIVLDSVGDWMAGFIMRCCRSLAYGWTKAADGRYGLCIDESRNRSVVRVGRDCVL